MMKNGCIERKMCPEEGNDVELEELMTFRVSRENDTWYSSENSKHDETDDPHTFRIQCQTDSSAPTVEKIKLDKTLFKIRRGLIDWLAGLVTIFNLPEDTLLLSLEIMDKCIDQPKLINNSNYQNKILLYAVNAFFISTKFEKSRHLLAEDVLKHILKYKHTKQEFIQNELNILKTLNYKINKNGILISHVAKILDKLFKIAKFEDKFENQKKKILQFCTVYYQLCLFDFKLVRKTDKDIFIKGLIIYALTSFRKIEPSFDCQLLAKLCIKLNIKNEIIAEESKKVEKIANKVAKIHKKVLESSKFKNIKKQTKEVLKSLI